MRANRRPRRAVRAAAVALTVGVLSSCSLLPGDPEPKPVDQGLDMATESAPTIEATLEPFYEQEPEWRECRGSMECAEIEVPLDYDEPTGKRIELALLRVPAGAGDDKVGSLLVNPGGPGGSGIEYAARAEIFFGGPVRKAFDIVGFDPRGVGTSTPVDCLSDEQLDGYVASDPDPETLPEARRVDELLTVFGEGCLERSGDLAGHVSTVEAAKDMDIIRGVLDQQRMAYFGASYGTLLGGTYADLFPERVGRMVLDGAIDPSVSNVESSLVQARGFETALRAYVENCVDDGGCFLGDSVDEGVGTIQDLLESLDEEPIPGDQTRALTQGLGVLGVWAPLYDEQSWPALDVGLKQAIDGNGATLLSFADQYVGRGPEGYVDNSVEALYAVNCLDSNESVPVDDYADYEDEFLEASPTFGRVFAFGLTSCGSWPVEGEKAPEALTAAGADPILVIGTTRDPATPLEWAEGLAAMFESGVLISRDGDGHTGYGAGNDCVDEAVESYLVSGKVPEDDLSC